MSDLPPHDLPRSPTVAPDPGALESIAPGPDGLDLQASDPVAPRLDASSLDATDPVAPGSSALRPEAHGPEGPGPETEAASARGTHVAGGPARPRPLPRPGIEPAAALAENAAVMFASARRVSICDDDAHDAVQAAAERFLRNVHRVEPATVTGWLVTVARNEALRVRERRVRTNAIEDDDRRLVHTGDGPEDLVARDEEIALAREALAHLKPHERLALWMQAEGRSYDEIAEELSWTRTKVNRNLTEGRARLRRALSGIATGEGCGLAGPRIDRLAGGEASAEDLRELRPHLRRCAACRGRLRRARGSRWGVLPPLVLAWLPWAGRGAGTAPPVRSRVAELVADRLALVLPATSGAVTEAGLALTTGLAVAALGAGVLAGGGAAEGTPVPVEERRTATSRVASAPAPARPAPIAVAPVASARATLASAVAVSSAVRDRAAERAADRRRAAVRERRRADARRRAAARRAAARRAADRRAAQRRRAGGVASETGATVVPPPPQAPVVQAPAPVTGGGGASSGGSSGTGSSTGSGSSSGGGASAADEFGFE